MLENRQIICLHIPCFETLNSNIKVTKLIAKGLRGGTICYFSVNIRDRFPGHMGLDAFCHNKTENHFENFEN